MRKFIMISVLSGAALGAVSVGMGSAATAATYERQGHAFKYPNFQSETFQTAIATDSAGHKMRLVKMHNGHMMVLVPADPYMALFSPRNEDMLQ